MSFNVSSYVERVLREGRSAGRARYLADAGDASARRRPGAYRLLHECALELRRRQLLLVTRGCHPGFDLLLQWFSPAELVTIDTTPTSRPAGARARMFGKPSRSFGAIVVPGVADYPIGAWSRVAAELHRLLVAGGLLMVFEEWKLEPHELEALITRGIEPASVQAPSSQHWTRRLAVVERARLDVRHVADSAATGRFLVARKPEGPELRF